MVLVRDLDNWSESQNILGFWKILVGRTMTKLDKMPTESPLLSTTLTDSFNSLELFHLAFNTSSPVIAFCVIILHRLNSFLEYDA